MVKSSRWMPRAFPRAQEEFIVGGFTEGKGSHEPAELICDDCDSSAEGENDQNEVESARSCIPSPALLASSWLLPSLISGCDPHKNFKPPSQQAEAPRAANIPETKNLFPLRFESLGSNIIPETELKLPSGDNRIF
jgi:hypothetical protein